MSDKTNELPTTEDDATTPLDLASDFLLDTTIPTPIRKGALKALSQLCTALIDVPLGGLRRRESEKWAETEARNKIKEGITAQTVEQMKVDQEYAQNAVKKYGEKILREQSNLDKICAIAAKLLKKEKSARSTDQGADSGEEKTINDDWLNNFENEARQKSSEEMQLRFGRILAGEIKNPGSYSIRAVKILGELNQNDATLFRKLCSICVILEIPTAGHILDVRVPSLGGNAGTNSLSKYGLGFDQLNILSEYGLIISDYNSWFNYQLCIANEDLPVVIPFRHQGRGWVLLPSPEQEKGKEFRLSGVKFSRVGRELFSIVDQDSMGDYTDDLKKFFARQSLQMVEIPSQDKT